MNEENTVTVEVKIEKRLFQLLQALSLLDGFDNVGRWLNNRLKDIVAADLDYLGIKTEKFLNTSELRKTHR